MKKQGWLPAKWTAITEALEFNLYRLNSRRGKSSVRGVSQIWEIRVKIDYLIWAQIIEWLRTSISESPQAPRLRKLVPFSLEGVLRVEGNHAVLDENWHLGCCFCHLFITLNLSNYGFRLILLLITNVSFAWTHERNVTDAHIWYLPLKDI